MGRPDCPGCRELEQRVAALEAQLAAARKHSGNSSKPPSSDIVKPPKDDPQGQNKKRRRGGQPGHAKHERPEFPPEQIDQTQDYTLTQCPDCGGKLQNAAAAPRLIQQVEISDKPGRIEEHRVLAYWCRHCQRVHYGALPQAVEKAGLAGPKLTALVGFLKGACHCSFSTIQKYFHDVLRMSISRGQLRKLCGMVAHGLKDAYEELLDVLPGQARANVDETGHK